VKEKMKLDGICDALDTAEGEDKIRRDMYTLYIFKI